VIDLDLLRRALADNDRMGEPKVSDESKSKGPDDLIAPSGLAIAADLGLGAEEANAMARVFFAHVGGGEDKIKAVMASREATAVAIGMYMGWLTRLRQEKLEGES
jgi:hypothetical protein